MLVSFNLINYNNGEYTEEFIPALESVLEGLWCDYEVVLVDSYSDDNSYEELKQIADKHEQYDSPLGPPEHCSRGEARNRCLELCNGEMTVDQVDTDQKPQPVLSEIVNWYADKNPDYCVNTNGCIINKYDIVKDIGYGNFQSGEDKHLWSHLVKKSSYKFLQINTCEHIDGPDDKELPNSDPEINFGEANEEYRDETIEAMFSVR
jgi:glycosyltransferase involved in cell wall biosynthesis